MNIGFVDETSHEFMLGKRYVMAIPNFSLRVFRDIARLLQTRSRNSGEARGVSDHRQARRPEQICAILR